MEQKCLRAAIIAGSDSPRTVPGQPEIQLELRVLRASVVTTIKESGGRSEGLF